jgi:hypothetical protein
MFFSELRDDDDDGDDDPGAGVGADEEDGDRRPMAILQFFSWRCATVAALMKVRW